VNLIPNRPEEAGLNRSVLLNRGSYAAFAIRAGQDLGGIIIPFVKSILLNPFARRFAAPGSNHEP